MERRLGAKLKEMRKSRSLTQTALGSALGVSFQQVQKYESGANRISVSTLLSVAKILDVPVYALLDVGGDGPTHRDVELILLADSLSDEHQSQLLEYARALAKDEASV